MGCSSLIIHRDVKSSNFLISAKLEGKMSDFGISRLQSHESADFSTKKLVGSTGYLDPEFKALGFWVLGFGASPNTSHPFSMVALNV
jgi:serine/threonine protein kinase